MRTVKALSLATLFVAGCVGHADVMLPHPLTSGGLSRQAETEIEKPESFAESNNGLPMGALTQRARLLKLDDTTACFSVELHSLRPDGADLRQLTAVLKDQPSGSHMEGAQITAGRATSKTYTGLVPHREATGSETFCASRDPNTNACNNWQTRPTYVTTMIPGPVNVYESSGKLCFAHAGLVTPKSERIILDLHKIEMVGFMPQRVAGVDFRWGFTGAATGKDK